MSHPLLRTLISEMVYSYLEESYSDNIIDSIFEEVSTETWEAIEEAILNELSPTTLKSYTKKAGDELKTLKSLKSDSRAAMHDLVRSGKSVDSDGVSRKEYGNHIDQMNSYIDRRSKGISRAAKKINKVIK